MALDSNIRIPTIKSWDDYNAMVLAGTPIPIGAILPDGSTILFANRAITATQWHNYDVSTDSPEFPTTAKDMAELQKSDINVSTILTGDQASSEKWGRDIRRDFSKQPSDKITYINTFKSVVDQLRKLKK